jgi:hypothetical protein
MLVTLRAACSLFELATLLVPPSLLLLPAEGALPLPVVLLELLLLLLEGCGESVQHSTQQPDNSIIGALVSIAASSHSCKVACIVRAVQCASHHDVE